MKCEFTSIITKLNVLIPYVPYVPHSLCHKDCIRTSMSNTLLKPPSLAKKSHTALSPLFIYIYCVL